MIAFQHVHSDPVPPRHLFPQIPEELEDLLLRMLAKDPAQRLRRYFSGDTLTEEPYTTLLSVIVAA